MAVGVLATLSARTGIGADQSPRAETHEVARVNGAVIMSDRLETAVAALIPRESFHRNVSAEKQAALREQALQSLVDDELEFQEGVRQAVTVSDGELRAAWDDAASRYGGQRGFDSALRRSGVSEQDARAELRRMAVIRKIYDREVTAKCGVNREQAQQFFDAHPERFVEPEQLHIQAITVRVDPSSGADEWAAARARAEDARRKLDAGSAFEDVVTQYATDDNKTMHGDLGFVHRGSLTAQFEEVAKDLPLRQPSNVIATLYGYHIIRVLEIRPAEPKSFEQIRATLQADLTAASCAERKDAWITELRAKAHVAIRREP